MNPANPPIAPESLLSHRHFVRAVAFGLLRDADASEDIEQETWIRAMTRPPRDTGVLRSWLRTVARNLARNRVRDEARRAERESSVARHEWSVSSDEIVEKESLRRAVVDAVLSLEEPYRTVLLLRFYDELPSAAIAARLGIPGSTVRTRIQRGLARLRERLDANIPGGRAGWSAALAPLLAIPNIPLTLSAAVAAKKVGIAVAVLLAFGAGVLWLATRPAPTPQGGGPADAPTIAAAAPRAEKHDAPATKPSAGGREPNDTGDATPLRGRVLFEGTEAPLANAVIGVMRYDKSAGPRATSRADGTFEIQIPRIGKPFHLRVDSDLAWYPRMDRFDPHEIDPNKSVVLLVKAAGTLEGWITRADGRGAVPDATVALIPTVFGLGYDPTSLRATTDAEGKYRFVGILPGSYEVALVAEGCAPRGGLLARVKANAVERFDASLSQEKVIMGRAGDRDGQPIEGVAVSARSSAGRIATGFLGLGYVGGSRATTGADGRFRLGGLGVGEWYLNAKKNGYVIRKEPGQIEIGANGEPPAIELVFETGKHQLSGRVVDDAGRPIAGAAVSVVPYFGDRPPVRSKSGWSASTTTSSDGRFVASGLSTGPYEVVASAAGFPPIRKAGISGEEPDFVVTLPAPASISGRVIDADTNLPIRRFSVSTMLIERTETTEQRSSGPSVNADDSQGRYAIAPLEPGLHSLQVFVQGYEPFAIDEISLSSGESKVEVDAKLVKSAQTRASVRGRVVEKATGKPIAGALVRAQRVGSSWSGRMDSQQNGWSGTDGTFVFEEIPVGKQQLAAWHEIYGDILGDVIDVESGHTYEGRVIAFPAAGSVDGTLIDLDGAPVAGAHILVSFQWSTIQDMSQTRHGTSDARGHFQIDGVPPAKCAVQMVERAPGEPLRLEGFQPVVCEVEEGKTTHVDLARPREAGAIVRGTVFLGNSPIKGAEVTWSGPKVTKPPGGAPRPPASATDLDGRFTLVGIPPGAVRIRASIRGYGLDFEGSLVQQVDATITNDPIQTIPPIRFAGAIVSGRVIASNGGPARDAKVTVASRAARSGRDGSLATVETDRDGRYQVSWLPPDTYEVSVEPAPESEDARATLAPVEIADSSPHIRDAALAKGTTLRVDLASDSGDPIGGADGTLERTDVPNAERDVWRQFAISDGRGRMVFRGLAPGEYKVRATARGYAQRDATMSVSVPGKLASRMVLTKKVEDNK
jgi:RNA polymerase sigma factor (sigma-70 family)